MDFATSFSVEGSKLTPCLSIPLSDRGFRFGMHFFETIAIRQSHWLYLPEHLEILSRSARNASFSALPESEKTLLLLPSLIPTHEGIARIFWTAGDGSPSSPPALGRIFVSISTDPLPSFPPSLAIGSSPFLLDLPFLGQKTGNYWSHTLPASTAKQAGFDDTLLFNKNNFLIGSCFGNAFVKIDNEWLTPPASDGAREGVTRAWLLKKNFGRIASIPASSLPKTEALLLCNSRIGPCPVASLNHRPLPSIPDLFPLWQEYISPSE